MWIENKVFEEVEDVGQKSISVRWVLTEKPKNDEMVVKARLVARGFEENTEDIRTDSPTCSKEAIRMLIALASTKRWICNSVDVKSAYLQGDQINRLVFLRPPPEFNIGKLWKLKKTVYGLADAARAWYSRVEKELCSLNVTKCKVENAFYVWYNNGMVEGIICIYVDDFLWAGTNAFERMVIKKLKQRFLIGSSASKSFTYLGLRINSLQDGIFVDQTEYISSLHKIEINTTRASQKSSKLTTAEESDYRSLVGQLNWIATQTRPDVAFDTCELSTAAQSATVENILKLNKLLRWVKENPLKIIFPRFTSLRNCTLECFTDAAFGNLNGGYSQGGFIIFLKDNFEQTCPIAWQSRKIQRAVSEVMAAETLALKEGAHAAINLSGTIKEITGHAELIKINCWVDNRNLQTAIYSTHPVDNRKLRVDIVNIKQMIEDNEIHQVKWVNTKHQIADVLTKRGVNKADIRAALDPHA